jgi:hypothetical protein
VPIGPCGGNERTAAVGQYHEKEKYGATPQVAHDGQSPTFERVPLTGNGHESWKMVEMGGLWSVAASFDSIDWELMLKAVCCHTNCPWVLAMAEGSGADGGREHRTANVGDPSGWGCQSHPSESVRALCV